MNLRTQVQHDLTEAQALDGLMSALKRVLKIMLILFQTVITSMRNHLKQAYDAAIQNAQNIINGQINQLLIKVMSIQQRKPLTIQKMI